MSGFSNDALEYAAKGYRVFPCRAGMKIPATEHGCKDATTDEDQICEWWSAWPYANIGISTDGLAVVDVDPLSDGSRNDWLDYPERLAVLQQNAMATTPRGGSHCWFRQSPGVPIRNSVSKIAPGVDMRGEGGYVVVPPSRTTEGLYAWIFDLPPLDRLTYLPDWLAEAAKQKTIDGEKLHLGGAEIPAGMRNDGLASIGGYLRRAGLSEAAIAATLQQCNVERCKPPLSSREVAQIAWSVSRYAPDQIAVAIAEGWACDDIKNDLVPEPGPVPSDLLNPGGFLQHVIDWNLATAYKRQPELALASALTVLATLIGRKRQDWSRTRTNLYCLGVADSGYGKEHARKIAKKVLQQGKATHLIGAESFGSAQGIVRSLEANPVLLFQVDEFGRFLKTTRSAINTHIFNVLTVLMKLYTSSDGLFIGDCVSDLTKMAKIEEPHACLYATTTPVALTSAMTPDAFEDGFMGRFLVFQADAADKPVQETNGAGEAPRDLLLCVEVWMRDAAQGGNLTDVNPAAVTLTAGNGTVETYASFDAECQERRNRKQSPASPLWARAGEKARKLGLLHALSLDATATVVAQQSAEWGVALARHLSMQLEYLAVQHIARNPYEAEMLFLLRVITDAGAAGITLSGIARKARHIPAKTRGEMLNNLEAGGDVKAKTNETGGRKAVCYVSTQFSQTPTP